MLPVRDVSEWQVVETEPLGRDRKVWLREPDGPCSAPTGEHNWLFKPVVVPQHGTPQGEDWVEKIVSRLGVLVGVTCADVDLARRRDESGSISRNVVPDGWELVLGSELMGTVVPGYQEGEHNPPGRPGHSRSGSSRRSQGVGQRSDTSTSAGPGCSPGTDAGRLGRKPESPRPELGRHQVDQVRRATACRIVRSRQKFGLQPHG